MVDRYCDYFTALAKVQKTKSKAFSIEEAKIFANFLTNIDSLKFDETIDGCTQRAKLIQALLEKRNVETGRVQINFSGITRWMTHIAPYTTLDTGEKVVFDYAAILEIDGGNANISRLRPVALDVWLDCWHDKDFINGDPKFHEEPLNVEDKSEFLKLIDNLHSAIESAKAEPVRVGSEAMIWGGAGCTF